MMMIKLMMMMMMMIKLMMIKMMMMIKMIIIKMMMMIKMMMIKNKKNNLQLKKNKPIKKRMVNEKYIIVEHSFIIKIKNKKHN